MTRSKGTCIGAKVESFFLRLSFITDEAEHGPFMACEDEADKGLIILEKDIVFGSMPFDEVIFENEGIFFGESDDGIDGIDLRSQIGDHVPGVSAFGKIVLEPSAQIFRLTDIEDSALIVFH